jgi:hypothetical protein
MQATRLMLIAAGALAVASVPAQAGSLRFTIEGPGDQTSLVSGTQIVESFESLTVGDDFPTSNPYLSAIGAYTRTGAGATTGTFISTADPFGGAGGTGKYLETNNQGGGNQFALDLTAAGAPGATDGGVGYFGFWWSAGDGNNELVITMKDGTTQTFLTQSILDSPALQGAPADQITGRDGHYGNPNYLQPGVDTPVNAGSNGIEAYAFVNIYANNDASRIANITFRELPGSTKAFESDNHTIIVDLINTGDQTGSEIPLPGTALLRGAGIGLIGWTRRRRQG